MKIGVSTVHDSSNFGSFLQAYALQKVLQDLGHEVFFIRTREEAYIRALYRPTPRQLIRHPFTAWRRINEGLKKFRCFTEAQRGFVVIEQEQIDDMDLVILGSDEIWNVNTPVFTRPVFYGVDMSPPVITYAVSAGNATAGQLRAHPKLVDAISSLQRVLVRDDPTAALVEELTGNEPPVVCDPTLLLDVEAFNKPYQNQALENGEYLVVYAYYVVPPLRKQIESFARAKGLKIVSPCFHLDWADLNIICDPFDFCAVLAGVRYVVTTTFHGSIFSALNQTRFVSLPTSVKTTDLLLRLGLHDRVLADDLTNFADVLENRPIDYAAVRQKLLAFRKTSMDQLIKALECGV